MKMWESKYVIKKFEKIRPKFLRIEQENRNKTKGKKIIVKYGRRNSFTLRQMKIRTKYHEFGSNQFNFNFPSLYHTKP